MKTPLLDRLEGILGDDETYYDFVVGILAEMPVSMVPSILLEITKIGYDRPIFSYPDGASRLVARQEEKLHNSEK